MASVPPYVWGSSEIRQRIVTSARAAIGWSPADAWYLDLIAPRFESAKTRERLLEVDPEAASALFAAGVLARAGVVADELEQPYVEGSAVRRLRRLGEHYGAWRAMGMPQSGDVVMAGAELAARKPSEALDLWLSRANVTWTEWGGNAQTFLVVERIAHGRVRTIEAQIGSPWWGSVAVVDRDLCVIRGELWLVDRANRWRKMAGFLDADALPFGAPCGIYIDSARWPCG